MFRKLLKHDMKAVGRLWWLMAITVLGASVIGSLTLRFILGYADSMEEDGLMGFVVVAAYLLVMLCFVVLVSSVAVTELLSWWRYYKNLFTDEGYLTFTLPASRKQILLAKTVNSFIWTGLHFLLWLVCAVIIMLIAPPAEGLFSSVAFEWVARMIADAWSAVGAWLILYAVLALLLFAMMAVFGILLVFLCITIGSVVAKKVKLLVAIAVYYGVSMVLTFVVQIFGVIGLLVMAEGMATLLADATVVQGHTVIMLILMIACTAVAAAVSIIYFVNLHLIERRLNLM